MTSSVAFLLPRFSPSSVGGYRVIYEYAERLRALGWQSQVVHVDSWGSVAGFGALREHLGWWAKAGMSSRRHVSWHPTRASVVSRQRPPWRLLNEFDRVVATSWLTAEQAAAHVPLERLCYLIQSYETWSGPKERVDATWRLPVCKVVIARWLEEVASELNAEHVHYIPNAVDVDNFPILVPIEQRHAASVALLWHEHPVKGSDVAIQVLEHVRSSSPTLSATAFSVYPRPPEIPEWVEWMRSPSRPELAQMLNRHAIFLSCSRLEGWALPPAEAMASGCALVSTDIGGVRDYARNGETALLAPVDDVPQLARALERMVHEESTRTRVARRGAEVIRTEFSWERSASLLSDRLRSW